MVNWQYYTKSKEILQHLQDVVDVFDRNGSKLSSSSHMLGSNEVLLILRKDLEKLGWRIEKGTKAADKINVPVLFGMNGKLEKHFQADGYHQKTGTVIEEKIPCRVQLQNWN